MRAARVRLLTFWADLALDVSLSFFALDHTVAQKAIDTLDGLAKSRLPRIIGTCHQNGLALTLLGIFHPAASHTAAKADAFNIFDRLTQADLAISPNNKLVPPKKNDVFGLFMWVGRIYVGNKDFNRAFGIEIGIELAHPLFGCLFSCFLHIPLLYR